MRARNPINFTHRGLEKLPIPATGKRATYFDSKVQNLNVIVTDTGTKTFYIRKVINGSSRRIRIGVFPDLSVENARNKAMQIKSAIAQGEDPHEMEKKRKGEPTFAEFFEHYLQHHAIPHKKAKSVEGDKQNYRLHLQDAIGNKKLSAITHKDISDIHVGIGKKAPYAANRVLSLARAVFNKASEWGDLEGVNPAAQIKPYKEQSRDRFIHKDELPRFFKALEEEPNRDICDYIYLSLLTGARKSNVLSMRWGQIHFERAEWRLEETKNDEPQVIPLVPAALEILKERHERLLVLAKGAHLQFVFPGRGKTGHMVEPKAGWKRILNRAEIQNLRLHDLRRTIGSYQAALGSSLHIIGKSLGHKSMSATQIYSRLDLDPVRNSMTQATDTILSFGKGK